VRLVPCIIDGQPIPRDLVESAVRRATNRIGIKDPKDKLEREWKKTLSIACALYKKFKEKENYSMSLDEKRNTRDYLYGRLLALADHIEESALRKASEKRATNATRYMQQFSQHPFRTWNQIHYALTPYIVRLGGAGYYKSLIAEVKELFVSPEDYMNDKPLSGEYLLGYYCQRQKLWEKVKKDEPSQEVEGNNESTEE
jgi:CRISPR-associated protein Csd1